MKESINKDDYNLPMNSYLHINNFIKPCLE